MKRFLLLSFVVLLAMAALAPSAFAAVFWCEDDPLVRVITPAGNAANVHVTNYGEVTGDLKSVRKALRQVDINYEVASINDGQGTAVKIYVLIPTLGEQFSARSIVTTLPLGRGDFLAETTGVSGEVMTLAFNLDIP